VHNKNEDVHFTVDLVLFVSVALTVSNRIVCPQARLIKLNLKNMSTLNGAHTRDAIIGFVSIVVHGAADSLTLKLLVRARTNGLS
jgi:hypothetical protein